MAAKQPHSKLTENRIKSYTKKEKKNIYMKRADQPTNKYAIHKRRAFGPRGTQTNTV